MFNTALHGQITPTMLLTVRKPGRRHARWSHNYVGDILASSNQVCFLFKQGVPSSFVLSSWQVESRVQAAPPHTLIVSLFANTALSAATGVAESNTDTAFTGEESSVSVCLSGSARRSGAAALCLHPTEETSGNRYFCCVCSTSPKSWSWMSLTTLI